MARIAKDKHLTSQRYICWVFALSITTYRYERLTRDDDEIADWLLRLTTAHKRWGFGLCFLYLRNVKGYRWNCKLPLNVDHNRIESGFKVVR